MARVRGYASRPAFGEFEALQGDYPRFISQAKHPDQLDDELFLQNVFAERDLNGIAWATKRVGQHAYTTRGRPVRIMRPVFIKTEEYKRAGLKPKERWKA